MKPERERETSLLSPLSHSPLLPWHFDLVVFILVPERRHLCSMHHLGARDRFIIRSLLTFITVKLNDKTSEKNILKLKGKRHWWNNISEWAELCWSDFNLFLFLESMNLIQEMLSLKGLGLVRFVCLSCSPRVHLFDSKYSKTAI